MSDDSTFIDAPSTFLGSDRPQSVLLVQREERFVEQARGVLLRRGYEVLVRTSCTEALALLRKRSCLLVVCDLELPGMDAFELIAHLREAGVTETPVLLTVLHVTQARERKSLQFGAVGLISRLSDPLALQRAMLAVLGEAPPAIRPGSKPSLSHWGGRQLDFLPPELPGFEIGRCLASGGMGAVFLARDLRLRRKVALKVLHPWLAEQPDFRERFLAEARNAASLVHPHVIQIYEVMITEDGQVPFFTMEHVEGRDLQTILQAGSLSFGEIIELGLAVARTLEAAARRDLVHRDLKPSNIMIAADGQIKVLDFGLAKCFGLDKDLTRTGQILGTPIYFSPEQSCGTTVDVRSDLYSLGVTLYQALAGAPPFSAGTASGYIFLHCFASPRSLRGPRQIPEGFEAILARLLVKDPEQRTPSPEALMAELEGLRGQLADQKRLEQRPHGSRLASVSFQDAANKVPYDVLGSSPQEVRPSSRRWVLLGGVVLVVLTLIAVSLDTSSGWGEARQVEVSQPEPPGSAAAAWSRDAGADAWRATGRGTLPLTLGADEKSWRLEGWLDVEGHARGALVIYEAGEPRYALRFRAQAPSHLQASLVAIRSAAGRDWSYDLEELQVALPPAGVPFSCELTSGVLELSVADNRLQRLELQAAPQLALEAEADSSCCVVIKALRVRYPLD